MPLKAVSVSTKVPSVLAEPDRVAVPLRLSVKVIPDGSVPERRNLARGKPLVVMVNGVLEPVTNDVLLALVMAIGWRTFSVKFWVALFPMVLAAVSVSG